MCEGVGVREAGSVNKAETSFLFMSRSALCNAAMYRKMQWFNNEWPYCTCHIMVDTTV